MCSLRFIVYLFREFSIILIIIEFNNQFNFLH